MDREGYKELLNKLQEKDILIKELQERLMLTERKLSKVENELADALEIIETAGL